MDQPARQHAGRQMRSRLAPPSTGCRFGSKAPFRWATRRDRCLRRLGVSRPCSGTASRGFRSSRTRASNRRASGRPATVVHPTYPPDPRRGATRRSRTRQSTPSRRRPMRDPPSFRTSASVLCPSHEPVEIPEPYHFLRLTASVCRPGVNAWLRARRWLRVGNRLAIWRPDWRPSAIDRQPAPG